MPSRARLVELAKKLVFGPNVRTAVNSELVTQSTLVRELERLQARMREQMPGNPAGQGFKAYSQADEDGVIAHICAALGLAQGCFVEVGCGDGTENNTHYLALSGWRGVWLDGSTENIARIRRDLPLPNRRLAVVEAFIDAGNATSLVRTALQSIGSGSVDLLSMDIDGNDLHVTLPLVEALQPVVLVVEYNARWRWPAALSIRYDATHIWAQDDYYGCSFARWVKALPGYAPVCCNLAGTNAFFVRRDRAGVFPAFEPQALEQPARHHLGGIRSGHTPTLKMLAHLLAEDRAA
jgi:hypothetical protein